MKTVIHTKDGFDRVFALVKAQPLPVEVEVRPYKSKRSLDQNALYWKWLTEIKNYLYAHTGETYTEDDLHDYYREQFLPVTYKTIGKVEIKRLTSTTGLSVQEMSDYMTKIDQRCIEKLNLLLPTGDA